MRKISILFAVLFLGFGSIHLFAQEKTKPKRAIILELRFNNLEKPEIFELPIDLDEIWSASGIAGSGVSNGCGECDESKLPPSYFLHSFYGSVVNKGKAKLFLSLDVNQTCKIRQKLILINNKPTKLKLKCDVDLVAYYGFESEEEN